MVIGPLPEEDTLREIRAALGAVEGDGLCFMLFESTIGDKTVYCCASGGELVNGQPQFTLIGMGALEALVNIPHRGKGTEMVFFQELKIGPTPIKEKIKRALTEAPDGAKICFVGDMQGELDGHILPSMNVSKAPPVYIGFEPAEG